MNRFMFAALLCVLTTVAQVPEGGGGGGGTGAPGPPGPTFSIDAQPVTAVKDDVADTLPIHSAADAGIRKIAIANILSTFALTDMAMAYGAAPADWTTPGTVPTNHKPGHKVQLGGTFPTAAMVKNHIATAIGGYTSVPSTSAFAGSAAGLTGQFSGGSAATSGTGVLGAAYPATGNTAGVRGARGLGESCTQSRAVGSIACPGSTIASLALVAGGEFATNNDSATTAERYSLLLTTAGTQPGVVDAAIGVPVVGAGVRKHVYGIRLDAGSVDFAMRIGPVDTGVSKASAAIHLVSVDGAAAELTGAIDLTAAGIMRFVVPTGSSASVSDGTAILSLPPSTMQTGIPLFSSGTPVMLGTTGSGDLLRATSPVITSPVIVDKTGMNHDHSTVANAGLLADTAFAAANKQGTATKFQMATTLAAGTGNPLCQDADGNTTMTCGGAASFATVTGTTQGDFSSATNGLRLPTASTGAPSGECDEAAEAGKIRVRSADPAISGGVVNICRQTGPATYGWMPIYGTTGTTEPATCAAGQLFFKTDASPGVNLYGCTGVNTWTLLGGTGTGGIISQDEGTQQGTAQTTVNFVGAGVLASSAGAVTTVTVPGGGVDKFAISTTVAGDLITLANSAPVNLRTGDTVNVIAAASNRTFVPSAGTCTARLYEQAGVLKVAVAITASTCDGTATNLTKVDADAFPAGVNIIGTVSISGGNIVDDSEIDLQAVFTAPKALVAGTNVTIDDVAGSQTINSTPGQITFPGYFYFPTAICRNVTAAVLFQTPATNPATVTCVTGSNTTQAVAQFADGAVDVSMQNHMTLPTDWTGAVDVRGKWQTSVTTGSVVWQLQTACAAEGQTGDPAWNTAQTVTDAARDTAQHHNDFALTGVTMTGCAAGEEFYFKIFRNGGHGADTLAASADLLSLSFTIRRLI